MKNTKKILFSIVSLILVLTLNEPAFAQDTVYGTINGGIPAEIIVTVYRINCGGDLVVASGSPDSSGNYSFGDLETGRLLLVPDATGYSFAPKGRWVDVPQIAIQPYNDVPRIVIQPYNFTATAD